MCNAWNHPPGCQCGWGGAGYSGHPPGGFPGSGLSQSYGFSDFRPFWYAPISGRSSYTNPNARCPVCGAAVFYYESEYGGRVFFDELGPPWPKHPCTDQASLYAPSGSRLSGQGGKITVEHGDFGWQRDGWEPLVGVTLHKFEVRGVAIMQVSGQAWGSGVRVFLPNDHLSQRAPWLVRRRDDDTYEFTTIIRPKTGRRDLLVIHLPGFPTAYLASVYARKHHFGTGVFRSAPGDAHARAKANAKLKAQNRAERSAGRSIP